MDPPAAAAAAGSTAIRLATVTAAGRCSCCDHVVAAPAAIPAAPTPTSPAAAAISPADAAPEVAGCPLTGSAAARAYHAYLRGKLVRYNQFFMYADNSVAGVFVMEFSKKSLHVIPSFIAMGPQQLKQPDMHNPARQARQQLRRRRALGAQLATQVEHDLVMEAMTTHKPTWTPTNKQNFAACVKERVARCLARQHERRALRVAAQSLDAMKLD
jgi:hypothetical protein